MQTLQIWASGDYPAVAEFLTGAGQDVVRRAAVSADDNVLDVACGNGNATLIAARTGARVTGVDITPELLEAGRAAAPGIEWVQGDAQALPFDDASFDAVISTFGCMFAPDHERAAGEILRVTRPGGRIAIACWTPTGRIGTFFATIGRHLAPADGPPPILWGDEAYVRDLFAGLDVSCTRGVLRFRFDSADAAFAFYTTSFGPLLLARAVAEDRDALDADLRAYYRDHGATDADGWYYEGEYLTLRATAGAAGPT
jgi:SAM-dependent methyltransferase